jgi:hypothetical protein
MSKKNNNQRSVKVAKHIERITKSLNKHGTIKGDNKKETKQLKSSCVHHRENRKGKFKPTFINTGNGYCLCQACGRKFETRIHSKKEVKKLVNDIMSMTDQMLVAGVSAGLGDEIVNYGINTNVLLSRYAKHYTHTFKAVAKSDEMKKKKKKNGRGYGNGGSEQYGGWSMNRR